MCESMISFSCCFRFSRLIPLCSSRKTANCFAMPALRLQITKTRRLWRLFMKPPIATKKLTTLSLLSAIALALYAVESALPPIVPIPGIKLGLANIITLVVLWKYSAKDAFFVLLVRILLATLFFGQAISLLYSLSGGLLCLLAMVFVQRLLHGHYLFLASMTGAVFHNLGQIGVAFLLTSVPAVLVYLPFLLLSGLVTGLFIGLCARFTLRFLP